MTGSLRICSFESRKGAEMKSLIHRAGAVACVVPSMQEVPLGITPEIQQFVDGIKSHRVNMVIFLTGVGAESLASALESEMPTEEFFQLLDQQQIVVRGPKPFAVLRKWGVHIDARAAEPNTWEEIIPAVLEVAAQKQRGTNSKQLEVAPLAGMTIAVQEYGIPAQELYDGLTNLGAVCWPVPVYRWALPDNLEPLQQAIKRTIEGEFDVIMITTAQQVVHTLEVAENLGLRDEWLTAAKRCAIASIGPTASERLRKFGLPVDFEPSHPHMGHLVRETVDHAARLLELAAARN